MAAVIEDTDLRVQAPASFVVPIEKIDLGVNHRPIDPEHVEKLAASIALRGLIVPLQVQQVGDRFLLIAGYHRYPACFKVGLTEVPVSFRDLEGVSGDAAAENILRKPLTPVGEAKAIAHMLDEGYTLDGAAEVLGFSRQLVVARAKILELPELAQAMLDDGRLPVAAVDVLLAIQQVSADLCRAVIDAVDEDTIDGARLVNEPAWSIGHVVRHDAKVFAEYLTRLHPSAVDELRLGKKAAAEFAEAEALHRQLDRHAYGPPPILFADALVDQARAAGVLLELGGRSPIIVDKPLYRELAKQAITATVARPAGRLDERKAEKTTTRSAAGTVRERPPREQLDVEHRAQGREHARQAHAVNLDLGAALLTKLATVDPGSIDVARFFAYGLLGPESSNYLGTQDHTARVLAANGIRLVLDEHRSTETPVLKSGQPGKTKITYADVEDAQAWLWKFVDGAKTAGELYGRVLVCFAAQHYASQLALPTSQRRSSILPRSHKDHARKAFARITKDLLPGSHVQLMRTIEREARDHDRKITALTSPGGEKQGAED